MDVKVPHGDEWHKVYPDMAREAKNDHVSTSTSRTKMILETPPQAQSAIGTTPLIGLLTGGNSILKVLSSTALVSAAAAHPQPNQASIGTISHDLDEVIYVSPKRKTT